MASLLADMYWSTLCCVKDYVPLLVAVVAAMTALAGYLLNGASSRRMERMRRYAEALDAVERYHQLPYLSPTSQRDSGDPRRDGSHDR